ncbi:MAG: hypothetical protein QG582_671 [Candidatus Thermoplasmatota archaeon]|nr:hypothetical protein [Candidatus Thermoplasmatota archaeon]
MTRYRRLKEPPVMVRKGGVRGVFAGMCAVLMVSCALAGLAMSTKGGEYVSVDLVGHEGQYEWRVLDRDLDPSTGGTFELRKPMATDGGLSFVLNDVSSGEVSDLYTVYMVWYGSLDMTGATTITAKISMTYTGEDPTLVCRNGNSPYTAWQYTDIYGNLVYYTPFVRLHFLSSTGDSWECSDYWWSSGDDGVEFAYLGFDDDKTAMSWTLTASLTDLASWSDRDGHFASAHGDVFSEALGDVREIGLSFGGGSLYANGVGVFGSESVVTFGLKSYAIA